MTNSLLALQAARIRKGAVKGGWGESPRKKIGLVLLLLLLSL
jgi:hypothetical protein